MFTKAASVAGLGWQIVRWQLSAGVLMLGVAWLVGEPLSVVLSVGYGALCAVVPTAIMVKGLGSIGIQASSFGFLGKLMVWELLKAALTVVMLLMATQLIASVSWLALVLGFIVATKAYWVGVFLRSFRKQPIEQPSS